MKDKNKLIIIADDDVDYLFQMEHYIKSFGFDVTAAHSQKEAELIIENTKPDLAIFDLMMERDDSGFILCHKMRRKHPNVPIILATAVASETGISFGVSSNEEKQY